MSSQISGLPYFIFNLSDSHEEAKFGGKQTDLT